MLRTIAAGSIFVIMLPFAHLAWSQSRDAASDATQDYKGDVIPLAELVEKSGGKLDADAAPFWLALKTDAGKSLPLLKDDGSRMFFTDSSLLHRPMLLTGRLLPGSQLLQVVEVHSYRDGKLCELYYWCPVCSIKRFEKKACDCCGGPMKLIETPVK
jgi:hypothetical protein